MDEHKVAAIQGQFINVILGIRDRIQVIADGERPTDRQVRHPRYGWLQDGVKKVTIKDAREIARHAVIAIDRAINEFDRMNND